MGKETAVYEMRKVIHRQVRQDNGFAEEVGGSWVELEITYQDCFYCLVCGKEYEKVEDAIKCTNDCTEEDKAQDETFDEEEE